MGLGALLVTNGVGALSAINGVGGCIAGSIPLRSIDRGLGMHHTMADGSYVETEWDRNAEADTANRCAAPPPRLFL
jgi:TPP-dependent 2-oxoacid decarboxylase